MAENPAYGASTGELVLRPLAGALAGVAAAVVAAALYFLVAPLRDVRPVAVFEELGSLIWPGSGHLLPAALLQLSAGALLGTLYALCQARAPARGLVAVGVFYGLFLWVIARVGLGGGLGMHLGHILGSAVALAASLVYGLILAMVAVVASRRTPIQAKVSID